MTNQYLTDTLDYGELVERGNDLLKRIQSSGKMASTQTLDAPPDGYDDLKLTIRVDPHQRLINAISNVMTMRASEFEGMMLSQDDDRAAMLLFKAFYSAIAKCLQIDSCRTLKDWKKAIEADTPRAYAIHDLLGTVYIYYEWQIIEARGKSEPQSKAASGGGKTD